MARRAKTSSKQPTPAEDTAPAPVAEPQRRGRKAKSAPAEPAEPSMVDSLFPGGEEANTDVADPAPPPSARRGRKAKPSPKPAMDEPTPPPEMAVTSDAPEPPTDEPAPAPTPAAAAKWDAETGTATFDWPAIEHVAATPGPNQAMAKLLLAAVAEGANSRWPF